MKILFTGMSSHHTKPSKNVTFFKTLAESVSIFASVEWKTPTINCTQEDFSNYDYVVVGLTPPTSMSANNLYGALRIIDVLYNSPKLVMVVDHPQLWQYKHGFNSIKLNSSSMFNTFYSKRREFSIASKKESVESIISGVNKLLTQKWPTTIYPSLPWSDGKNYKKFFGSYGVDSLVPVNLDSFLLNDTDSEIFVGNNWIVDNPKSTWISSISKFLTKPIYPVSNNKKINDKDALDSIKNSFAFIFTPQERGVGTWWSYRLIQALNTETAILSDWKVTHLLGPEWSLLSYDLENKNNDSIAKIAKLQKESYKNNIPSKEDSVNKLKLIFK